MNGKYCPTRTGRAAARAHDPAFPGSVDKRGTGLLCRVGDLKCWARHRSRAASGTTVLG
ncbi:hypothetical protein [Streptomyces sp. NPDC101150]|uniref:hypothetical protein n=1 Tax=Streptomyces sp. NPDC101150 TaxID=3366114 RepID=UPI00380B1ACB